MKRISLTLTGVFLSALLGASDFAIANDSHSNNEAAAEDKCSIVPIERHDAPVDGMASCHALPSPECGTQSGASTGSARAGENTQVLFLQFDGLQIYFDGVGPDNARSNITVFEGKSGIWRTLDEFRDSSARKIAADKVAAIFAPFDVEVTYARPTSGEYTMIVVGSHSSQPSGGGFSPGDCNNQNRNNIAFVASASPELIAHEAAHSFGLMHVVGGDVSYIMNGTVFSGGIFAEPCIGLADEDGCPDIRAMHCSGSQQSSFSQLCGTLGPSGNSGSCDPDAEPPGSTGPGPGEPDPPGGPDPVDPETPEPSDPMVPDGELNAGCSAAGTGTSNTLWLVMGVILMVLGRRRRRSY